jgi:hypothetical protein
VFEITITYKSLIPIIGSTTAGEIALPVFEPNAAMPNGGHASPWSPPHHSDEEIWAEKIRWRYLGKKVVKRWKQFVARNKRARDLEEYLRAPRGFRLSRIVDPSYRSSHFGSSVLRPVAS